MLPLLSIIQYIQISDVQHIKSQVILIPIIFGIVVFILIKIFPRKDEY